MIFWIFLGLVALILLIGALTRPSEYEHYRDKYDHWIIVMRWAAGFTILYGLLFSVTWIERDFTRNPARDCTTELAALGTGSDLQGQIYLSLFGGSGSINQHQTITYLAYVGDGVQLREVPASEAVIVESNEDPKMVCVNVPGYNNISDVAPWLGEYTFEEFDHYKFHVPEGSVERKFEVTA